MGLPPQLEIDIEYLKSQGYDVDVCRDTTNPNRIFVIFNKYKLPKGWNMPETNLLIITDISYPNSKIDMFWVDQNLRLANGNTMPQNGGCFETYNNTIWQRLSWHVQKWNPAVDNVITYLGTIDSRLSQIR